MKLYTVALYNLRMCTKEDNSDPNYFKGDKWLGCGRGFRCSLTHTSS